MAPSDAWVLLTWRGRDPSPPAPFAEAYFCPTCGDYFGLAFEPHGRPRASGIAVLAAPKGRPRPIAVFCPKCGGAYPQYGEVGVEAAPAEAPGVMELLVSTFPRRAAPVAKVEVGELMVERFVLLISGPLPPRKMITEFTTGIVDYMIKSMIGAPVRGGAVPFHVLGVTSLSDETPWLSALLTTHVYHGALDTRQFASLGPLDGPSGTQVLLCAVMPAL